MINRGTCSTIYDFGVSVKTNSQKTVAWIFLLLAGLSEIAWAVGIKLTHGFTHLGWSIFTIAFMIVSFILLAKALTKISLGTTYAIFTGIGTAGAALVGIFYLGESAAPLKLISLVIIIVGIVGLRFVEDTGQKKEDTSIC